MVTTTWTKLPRGDTCTIHEGGPTELCIANQQKTQESESLHPKNTWHQNFRPKKRLEVLLKRNFRILFYLLNL